MVKLGSADNEAWKGGSVDFAWILAMEEGASFRAYRARVEPVPKGMAHVPKSLTRTRQALDEVFKGGATHAVWVLYEVSWEWCKKANITHLAHGSQAAVLDMYAKRAHPLLEPGACEPSPTGEAKAPYLAVTREGDW